MSKPSFNLIDRPWIRVGRQDGSTEMMGIREVLQRAHELRDLRDDSPLVVAAIVRLLLAVLYRAYLGPRDEEAWWKLWKAGQWDRQRIDAYLDKWHGRFDLFDRSHPFMQVADLGIEKQTPVAALAHELTSGNNDTLFDHHHDESPRAWPPDVVARWLVATQTAGMGGGKSGSSKRFGTHPNRTAGPLVGRVHVFVQGRYLFEFLALAMDDYPNNGCIKLASEAKGNSAFDRPCWEVEQLEQPGERRLRGIADYLTWQCRAVRLHPIESGFVERMEFSSLYTLPATDGWRDPWAIHTYDEKRGILPYRVNPDRALWRDSLLMIPQVRPDLMPVSLRRRRAVLRDSSDASPSSLLQAMAVGIASDQAKVLAWREDRLPLPVAALEDSSVYYRIEQAIQAADSVAEALRGSMWTYAQQVLKVGESQPRNEDCRSLLDHAGAEAAYWDALNVPFIEFAVSLASPKREAEEARVEFGLAACSAAVSALEVGLNRAPGDGPRAWRGRVSAEQKLRMRLGKIKKDHNLKGAERELQPVTDASE